MISCVIPLRNESPELLNLVIRNLTEGIHKKELQLILVNDGSVNPDGSHRVYTEDDIPWEENTYMIDNKEQYGVGHCFDRGVEVAVGDTIVLLGADVFPERRKWLESVRDNTRDNEIGCCCSVGLQPGNYDINQEGLYERFGARILYTLTIDDLPKNSPLRKNPNYKDILESKWMPKQSSDPYEVPCLMGAFYWCKKEFYQRIHGWDTEKGKFFRGHMRWGCLENHLSLKARVYGGKIVVYPNIRVGHVFGRITDKTVDSVRSIRADLKFWNKLFVAHTLLDDELRDEVINYLPPSLNYGIAQVAIKKNLGYIQEIRTRNKKEGKLISKND